MLTLMQASIDAIKQMAPGGGGLRLFMPPDSDDSDLESIRIEVSDGPHAGDEVIDADGASLFLEPRAAAALDDKVLDAAQHGDRVRFAVMTHR